MFVSDDIQLDVEEIIKEISVRLQMPWKGKRINDYNSFPMIKKLFEIMNSGIAVDEFFYKGDLFRIHSSYVGLKEDINPDKERIVSKIASDGSCAILPITEYSKDLVSYTKSPDFINNKAFYKVDSNEVASIFHVNTKELYGIDVNKFLSRYGFENKLYKDENEVLFPLEKRFVVKEYIGTPNQINYYLRKFI